jgi:hypothetical protein
VDGAGGAAPPPATLPGMAADGTTIAVPVDRVRALAATLTQLAGDGDAAAARFTPGRPVGGPLQAAVEDFLTCHRAAARALAGEVRWLGAAVGAVAASWARLDAGLLTSPGRARPR